jgi:hypothetical protein
VYAACPSMYSSTVLILSTVLLEYSLNEKTTGACFHLFSAYCGFFYTVLYSSTVLLYGCSPYLEQSRFELSPLRVHTVQKTTCQHLCVVLQAGAGSHSSLNQHNYPFASSFYARNSLTSTTTTTIKTRISFITIA